jgi:adenine phosphoribosyltransferase
MDTKDIDIIKNAIRDIPDFPKKGIIFKDITTLLKNPDLFKKSIELLDDIVKDQSFDAIVAIESRGFIFGAVLAYKMDLSFVPVRKPGKLPAEVLSEEYSLEYGTDNVEMHADGLEPGSRVLLVDDLMATGGTAQATCRLIERSGSKVEAVLFLIELKFLNGRDLLKGYDVRSLISYD